MGKTSGPGDLSRNATPPPVGDVVQLIFDLPREGRPTIRAEGEVVRRADPGVGIRLHTVSSRNRVALVRCVGKSP